MKQQDVRQFIIVPPAGRKAEIAENRGRLVDYLVKRFSRFSFEVAKLVPVQDEDHFIVIPIMTYRSPDGDALVCRQPEKWLLTEIAEACAEFNPRTLRSFAA